jgi:hypothetical protein
MVVNAKVRARGDYVSSLQGGGPIRLRGTIGTAATTNLAQATLAATITPGVLAPALPDGRTLCSKVRKIIIAMASADDSISPRGPYKLSMGSTPSSELVVLRMSLL